MIKETIKKLNRIILMSALMAGIIFSLCGFAFKATVPKGVTVNGVNVGGLTRDEAAKNIRIEIENAAKEKTLTVRARKTVYTYTYPEIYYKDNVYYVLKNAEKGGEYSAQVSYYLCGLNEIATVICRNESVLMVEPYAEFSAFGSPFKYCLGNDGKEVDMAKLVEDIKNSLKGGFEPVEICYKSIKRTKNVGKVREETKVLGTFTTYYDGTNLNRASNIRLAAAKLNGTVIEGGKTLSFNDIVGSRVKERGFLPAKIILNGEYTDGIGGGVCQVSTTLYNAALLSGLKVEEYHPHSLAVGYVPPSRDAMVSGTDFDLKIKNSGTLPVYIRASTTSGSVTFTVYGKSDGAKYSLNSEVVGSIEAPEEKTEDPLKVRDGKDGTLSEGYLVVTRGGYTRRVLLRKDKYLPVARTKLIEPELSDEQNIELYKN